MFGFGRKAKIAARAQSVGDLMLLIVGCANSMPLRELIEANHSRGFVDGTVDLTKGEYEFFERDPKSADFGFLGRLCINRWPGRGRTGIWQLFRLDVEQ
jgi:hypothetical protein